MRKALNLFGLWRAGNLEEREKIYLIRISVGPNSYLKVGRTQKRMFVRMQQITGEIKRAFRALPVPKIDLVNISYPYDQNHKAHRREYKFIQSRERAVIRDYKKVYSDYDPVDGFIPSWGGETELIEDTRENIQAFRAFFDYVV